MRVLFIAQNLDRPETHLLRGLADRGIQVRLLAPATVKAEVETAPIRLNGRIDRKAIGAIRQHTRDFAPDVVHCLRSNRPVANALLALRGTPPPLVCYRGTLGNLGRWDPGSRLTYLNPRIARIICVSNAVRSYLSTLVPPERLTTIYKGHDPEWYPSTPVDRAAWGIPPGAFVVGCAANMRPLKGADVLIRSAAHLATHRPVHYLLVGEVRDSRIHQLVRQTPYREVVHLAGFRKDAAAISGSCDVFVMPTRRREGLPRAVIEAMAQAVPAIVTRVGGMPELVPDGTCGLVVPPDDPTAIGKAISSLANHPDQTRRFGIAARHRIKTTFGVSTYIDKTLALYQDL